MKKEDLLILQKQAIRELDGILSKNGQDGDRTELENGEYGENLLFEFNGGLNNEPVLAQYFFLPLMDEEVNVYYFTELLTIADDITEDSKKVQMLQAFNLINAVTPFGNFQFDANLEIASYRYTVSLLDSMSYEDVKKLIYNEVFKGIAIVSRYLAPINAYLFDRITWDEFIYTIASINDALEE